MKKSSSLTYKVNVMKFDKFQSGNSKMSLLSCSKKVSRNLLQAYPYTWEQKMFTKFLQID